jgi:FMN phosphatase YigB (HAD superfamily)
MKRLTEQDTRLRLTKAGLELVKEWYCGRQYHIRISHLISAWNSDIASFKSLKELNEWFDERFKDKETMFNWIDKTDIDENEIRKIQRKTGVSKDEAIKRVKMLKKAIVRKTGVFPYGMYIGWSYEDRLILALIPNYAPSVIKECLQEVGMNECFDDVITI